MTSLLSLYTNTRQCPARITDTRSVVVSGAGAGADAGAGPVPVPVPVAFSVAVEVAANFYLKFWLFILYNLK